MPLVWYVFKLTLRPLEFLTAILHPDSVVAQGQ